MSASVGGEEERTLLWELRAQDDAVARRAFETLFSRHAARLVAFTTRYVHATDVAHDIVHDVFVWIWEHRNTIPDCHLTPYLMRAARNRALNVIEHEAVVAQWAARVRLETGGREPSEENAAEQALERGEMEARVRDALAALTPRVREIVRLNREEQLKPGEIAELLGLAPATVYAQLSRALKQLATALRD